MSTASAKPEPKPEEGSLEWCIDQLGLYGYVLFKKPLTQEEKEWINSAFSKVMVALKKHIETDRAAPPAAERTVLKELRADISRTATTGFNASRFKKYVIQQIDLIMELDAQERAGAKAD